MNYEIVKVFHILAVISWMVGLLYVSRLFVYHSQTQVGSVQAETFKVMERRLLRAIMTPAMVASFVFGCWLVVLNHGLLYETWFQIKFAAVIAMGGVHGEFRKCVDYWKQIKNNYNQIVTEFGMKSLLF